YNTTMNNLRLAFCQLKNTGSSAVAVPTVAGLALGFGVDCFGQSQRDCITQPRVGAPTAYPGCTQQNILQPQRGCIHSFQTARSVTLPFQGCSLFLRQPQGSSRPRNPGLMDRIPLGFTGRRLR